MNRYIIIHISIPCRESGLHSSIDSDDNDLCAVCLERACSVAAEGELEPQSFTVRIAKCTNFGIMVTFVI